MQKFVLHDEADLQWIVFGRDQSKFSEVIDTNEYLIISKGEAMLLDPGGIEIFPQVLAAISEATELERIKAYLCSHQDPDIMSSLPLWLALTPDADIHLSWIWEGFVSHFGREYATNFKPIADEGGTVTLGGRTLQFVPAHYCHSSGNFNVFDPESRILFSGDMGAALVPDGHGLFVEDFDKHVRYMETFHRRWMPSNEAKNAWVSRIRRLSPRMICPQHGAIFKEEHVGPFLDWIEELEVGKVRRQA